MAALSISTDRVRSRIVALLRYMSPDSPEARAALFRIGTLMRNLAMEELTLSGAVDRGGLRASLQFAIETSENVSKLTVFSQGKKYARIVEVGGAFTPAMRRAMFASFRERGIAQRAGKGIVKGGYYRGRPYMSPAARRARPMVIAEIRNLLEMGVKA